MQDTVNVKEYIDIFKRRKWIIIVVMAIFLAFGVYKTYKNHISYRPTYTSTATIRINVMKPFENNSNNKSNEDGEGDTTQGDKNNSSNYTYNSSAQMQNQTIATSYVGLVNKAPFRKKVATLSGIRVSHIGSITAAPSEDIPTFIDLKVISTSPEIAKTVAEVAPEAYNQELIEIAKQDCVEVVYKASDAVLIPKSRDLSLLKSLAVGMVISVFLVLLIECLDTRIKTPNDVDKYWDLPLIGVIPMDDGKKHGEHSRSN